MVFPFLTLFLAVVARASAAADAEMLRRVVARDPRGLRTLYDRTSGVVLAVALRILRSRSDAEDIVQEAFVEAWRRAETFDPARGTASAWIVAIARSRALDRLRTRGSTERTLSQVRAEEPERVALPIESAEQREDRTRVQSALAALPAEQRAVVELAYFEGLTQREIAERTGDPLGTVKTRVRLALEKLSGLLAEGT